MATAEVAAPGSAAASAKIAEDVSQWTLMRWRFARNRLSLFGLVVLVILYLLAIIAPFLSPYPYNDIWDPLARVFDAWGFERCLWGTDWTRAFAVVNYENAVTPFRETNRLNASERAMLMGGACEKAYRWAPQKS